MPFDSNGFDDTESEWMYRHAFTIDPGAVEEAWETLTMDEWVYEISQLPKTLHAALIQTLRERRSLDRIEQGRTV